MPQPELRSQLPSDPVSVIETEAQSLDVTRDTPRLPPKLDPGQRLLFEFRVLDGVERFALGFLAKTITVHNLSGGFLLVEPLRLIVPPYTVNVRFFEPAGVQQLSVRSFSPPGVSSPGATSEQICIVEADSRELPVMSGLKFQ